MDDCEVVHTLRAQNIRLYGVFALAKTLFDRINEDEIVKLVVGAVPALVPCRVEGIYLVRDELRRSGDRDPLLRTQLSALAGAEGQVSVPGVGWAWCYPLRTVRTHSGYLVVTAEAQPSTDEQFVVRMLAHQAGAALTSAALCRSERTTSEVLRKHSLRLATVNQALRGAVVDLERRIRTHELLAQVAAIGGAAPEIADALYDLTGLAVVVEDKFGNLLGSAGAQRLPPRPQSPADDRTDLLNQVQRNGRPMRYRDRILALVQPRDEVLGVLALVDPERRAGQFELFALQDAAVALAVERAHRRSVAETEFRLRGDLLDDLLTGADDDSAIARSAALGHDLRPPHQVLVVSWPGIDDAEMVTRAVDQATARITRAPVLLTRRDGKVVLVAPAHKGDGAGYDWNELHRLISAALPCKEGTMGVGRRCANPSELPRSYSEALRALGLGRTSTAHRPVTVFENLGFYRMLGSPEGNAEVDQFVREWLGPLLDYDATHHYNLVSTLWQYYECGGNYDATAHALLIHRSTLRYRLRRIRELTGYDLGAVDARFNLHIATRIWRMWRGASRA